MPILLALEQVAVPPAPTVPALITVEPGRRVSSAWCVWPTRNTSGSAGGSASSSVQRVGRAAPGCGP